MDGTHKSDLIQSTVQTSKSTHKNFENLKIKKKNCTKYKKFNSALFYTQLVQSTPTLLTSIFFEFKNKLSTFKNKSEKIF